MLDGYVDTLLYRMHLTKGARYQAARRHQRRAIASIWSIIALSMYVFTASTVLAIYDLSAFGSLEQHLIIANMVMSAFIIAFSVLEQGKKHDLKAELFLRCAQGIQRLRDELEFDRRINGLSQDDVAAAVKSYNDLVHDFSDNHSETDYRTFRINIGKHQGEFFYSIYQPLKYWFDCWSIMLISIFVPPMALLLLYWIAK
ncbi:SLATT domain-containing protein [Roseibium aquae]|nr:SLATT domain-containing protein [Roseibium aquae]